jgi:hypothetical protein
MDSSKCLVFERWVPLGFEKVHSRSRCQVQTEAFVSKSEELAAMFWSNLPTSTTSDRDQYDTYARVAMELLYGVAAVLWLYFAINAD